MDSSSKPNPTAEDSDQDPFAGLQTMPAPPVAPLTVPQPIPRPGPVADATSLDGTDEIPPTPLPAMPAPVPIDDPAFEKPRRVAHDGATRPVGVSPIPAPSSSVPIPGGPSRGVRAGSNRIEGDIKVGRGPHHNLITFGLLGLALAALAIGVAVGLSTSADVDSFQTVATSETAGNASGSGIDLEAFAQTNEDNLVQLTVRECGVRGTVVGIATDATTVVVTASAVRTDSSPLVTTSADEQIPSRVLGVSRSNDLAVVRLSTPLASGGFGWSGANQAPKGTDLVVLDATGGQVSGTEAVVTGNRLNNDGFIGELYVNRDDLEPGSVVLDQAGSIVGVVDTSGGAVVSAESLQRLVGRIKVNPSNPSSVCPPVSGPAEVSDGESSAGENSASD